MAEEDLCIEVSDGSDESGDEGIAEDDDNLKAFVAVFKEVLKIRLLINF